MCHTKRGNPFCFHSQGGTLQGNNTATFCCGLDWDICLKIGNPINQPSLRGPFSPRKGQILNLIIIIIIIIKKEEEKTATSVTVTSRGMNSSMVRVEHGPADHGSSILAQCPPGYNGSVTLACHSDPGLRLITRGLSNHFCDTFGNLLFFSL